MSFSGILTPQTESSPRHSSSTSSASLITVMETDFPVLHSPGGSGSSVNGVTATTRHRSVESNGHSGHQDSVESNHSGASLKSPIESNGTGTRKYGLPPKLPPLSDCAHAQKDPTFVDEASRQLLGSERSSAGIVVTIEPSESPGFVPTPPPPPLSTRPSFSLSSPTSSHLYTSSSSPSSLPRIPKVNQKFTFPPSTTPTAKPPRDLSSSSSLFNALPNHSSTKDSSAERENPHDSTKSKTQTATATKVKSCTAKNNSNSCSTSTSICSLASEGGLKSKKLKLLIHPLDRSIVGIFTLTIFFTILAILTGAPTVLLLFTLVPLSLLFKKLFLCHFSDLLNHEPLNSVDTFWLASGHVTHCLLYVDKGLSLQQLRDVLASRLLSKPELARFKSTLVYRGLCRIPYWKYQTDLIAIEEHVVEDEPVRSKKALRARLMALMSTPLCMERPLWEVRYAAAPYCGQVILIVRVHQALSQSGLVSILTHYLSDSVPPIPTGTKPRFGGVTLSINIFRAIIVGPLTFFLWILWAFTRRHANYLTRGKELLSVHWTAFDLPKIYRIKQVTRSSLNDVLISSIAGSIRDYLTSKTPIINPPDLMVSIPIDIRPSSPIESSLVGINYVLTTSPIPTNTEGAIPRLWEVRHLMEELKTSADTAVMYGAHYLLNRLLPRPLYRFIVNLVNRNSSLYVSNIQGPETPLSIGSHRLVKAYYFLSPPSYCSIVYNIFTLHDKLYLSISTRSSLISDARLLTKLFRHQIDLLHLLLSRRRVPGESKRAKRAMFLGSEAANHLQAAHAGLYHSMATATDDASLSPGGGGGIPRHLSVKLHEIQDELNRLSEAYDMGEPGVAARYEELKEEFTGILYEMRRRKSIADFGGTHGNILINIENEEDDDNDGELRPPPRRFSVVSMGRRGSIVSSLPSTSRVTPPILSRRSMAATSPEPPSSPEVAFKIETEC